VGLTSEVLWGEVPLHHKSSPMMATVIPIGTKIMVTITTTIKRSSNIRTIIIVIVMVVIIVDMITITTRVMVGTTITIGVGQVLSMIGVRAIVMTGVTARIIVVTMGTTDIISSWFYRQ